MKKILLLLTIFFCPLSVMAYSEYIIPGGMSLGIEVDTKGIMVIGFYKVDGKFNKGDNSLQVGDYITKINDKEVNTLNEMTSYLENEVGSKDIKITFMRNQKEYTTSFPLIYSEGKYKTGLYVKDSIKGIGSLSYIDIDSPNKVFGALGHEIIDSSTSSLVEIKSGEVFYSEITGLEKSKVGSPGSKLAKFNYNDIYGTINKNTKYGIFGSWSGDKPQEEKLKVGKAQIGPATVRTVLNGNTIESFDIEIIRINENSETKNLTIRITSEDLLDKTGGVIQGMSGSPIIQNNEIVGVLTHVIVDNPLTGYGIFITKMLEEGEK